MEEETTSVTLKKSLQSSKDFVGQKYHNLTDFITKTYTVNKDKGRTKRLKITCVKYALIFMDIAYLLTSLVMINIGVFSRIVYVNFRSVYQFEMLPICWIATGAILLFVSIFGLIGAFNESNISTNIFGVLLTIVFVIQISSAIYAFQFIGQSQWIASTTTEGLMNWHLTYNDNPLIMDWIQRHYKCCGSDGPIDWSQYYPYKQARSYGYSSYYASSTTESTPLSYRMPSSCCVDESNYNNLSCDKYYQNGCTIHVREMISATTMIVGSVALVIAVFEVLGIAFAFAAARIFRKTKSLAEMQLYDVIGNSTANREQTSKAGESLETI
ncbi:tetraspanin-33-like [Bradysia coprophila]|uniref:tetraspanin-33-like n=1 Tax=Bradysia coprophila TaxID=38358 RepID=UPI00187D88D3|nr:tetraspanin-33-like [Bradysia coprophila]